MNQQTLPEMGVPQNWQLRNRSSRLVILPWSLEGDWRYNQQNMRRFSVPGHVTFLGGCNPRMVKRSWPARRHAHTHTGNLAIHHGENVIPPHACRQTDRQTARQPDSQTARQSDSQTARQPDSQTARQPASQPDRQTDTDIPLHQSTVQYSTVHSIAFHCVPLHSIAFHLISVRCITLHYFPLRCFALLYYITLLCITAQHITERNLTSHHIYYTYIQGCMHTYIYIHTSWCTSHMIIICMCILHTFVSVYLRTLQPHTFLLLAAQHHIYRCIQRYINPLKLDTLLYMWNWLCLEKCTPTPHG